jgi:imidazolonepropionase-like amidohydrolase
LAGVRLTRRRDLKQDTIGSGVALFGRLWRGDAVDYDEGRVVVGADGLVIASGAAADVPVPFGVLEIDGGWVGPGLTDAHVHLAFGAAADCLAHGVVAVRDLGAPPIDALAWRAGAAPRVEIAGPLVTAPGGYPSRSWGSNGFAAFVDDPDQARRLVAGLAAQVDVVKLALEPRGGPVPDPATCAAVVEAAHAAGRRVTCHALTVAMVERALDAGVDELAHTPTEPLSAELVARVAAAGVRVVSTLHTFAVGGDGAAAVANAAALVAAGVDIRYGTDLGNAGIKPGADLRELALLAIDVGLGAEGTLRSATTPVTDGHPAGLVVLDDDPRDRPSAWRHPRAVVVGTTLLLRG